MLCVRRAHVLEAMTRAGIAEPERVANGMYVQLATGLLEVLGLAFRRSPLPVELDLTALGFVLGAGRGAVVATAHTGSWDVVACAAAERLPLCVVSKRLSIAWLDRVWHWLRGRRGVVIVHSGDVVRGAARALARGELCAMMIDQAPISQRGATRASFLGADVWVDCAPALVALRTRAPIVAVFPRRTRDGRHVAEIAGVLWPPSRPERAWADEAMRTLTGWLEGAVRGQPEQWLWMHRRWKALPSGRRAARV